MASFANIDRRRTVQVGFNDSEWSIPRPNQAQVFVEDWEREGAERFRLHYIPQNSEMLQALARLARIAARVTPESDGYTARFGN